MAFQETWSVASLGLTETSPKLFAPLGSPSRTENNVFINCLEEFQYNIIFLLIDLFANLQGFLIRPVVEHDVIEF